MCAATPGCDQFAHTRIACSRERARRKVSVVRCSLLRLLPVGSRGGGSCIDADARRAAATRTAEGRLDPPADGDSVALTIESCHFQHCQRMPRYGFHEALLPWVLFATPSLHSQALVVRVDQCADNAPEMMLLTILYDENSLPAVNT